MGVLQRTRRALLVASLLVSATAAHPGSSAPDDAIRWRTRLIAEHREFVGVWVDTRELAAERAIDAVTVEVSCLDAQAAPLRSESLLFTDGAQPQLRRGVVYLRYFRHSCAGAHKVVGSALRWRRSQ